MRRFLLASLLLCLLCSSIGKAAHVSYRPLQIGLVGEDIFELQLTLGFFGHTLGAADGELDELTWQALLTMLALDADTEQVTGEHLTQIYWFYLARNWPEHGFVVPPEATWEEVAGAFGVSVEAMRLVNDDRLTPGSTCYVPVEFDLYRVEMGETLLQIAERYQVDAARLAYWNQIRVGDELTYDQYLIVVMDW